MVWQPAGVGPGALALVLTAAVLHAVWNLAAKGVTEDRLLFIWLYAALSVVVWVPVGVVWVVVTGERPQWVWLGAAALSAAMHIGYQLALQRGYAEGELNVVYPVARGTGPLVTFVVAATVLDERPGVVAGIGVLLVVVGRAAHLVVSRGGARQPLAGCPLGTADRRRPSRRTRCGTATLSPTSTCHRCRTSCSDWCARCRR